MPYKKGSLAEQMGKLRRTGKRRLARLEKEQAKAGSEKERYFYQTQIDRIRDEISKTYQINPETHKATGYKHDDIRIAGQNLRRANQYSKLGTSNQSRKNFLTQQELNMAESVHMEGPQAYQFTREEVSIFYRATQHIWEGLPSTANRNEAIMDAMGVYDLETAVRLVLEANSDAVSRQHRELTESEADEKGLDRERSAEYYYAQVIDAVTMFNEETLRQLAINKA